LEGEEEGGGRVGKEGVVEEGYEEKDERVRGRRRKNR